MFRELLRSEFQPFGSLSELQLDQLERHYELLVSWNRRLNLTRIRDLTEVVRFHYCESLYVSTVLPDGPLNVCDVGSGAGFPGIPLAVIRSNVEMTLIEADQRKAVFLREATRKLRNVQVVASRYQGSTARFDWVVSRAVSHEDILASRLAPSSALLVAARSAPDGAEIATLPWGRDRVLAVSRGTSVSPVHVSRETFSC
jgi:16S rRNA (guanine(527)-N(7))-methyltransferase RsmG